MLKKCGHCGSADVMAGLDMFQCLHCGDHTKSNGELVPPRPSVPMTTWFGRSNIDGPDVEEK